MNVLYLSYTGLLEPLGQSQVLNYLVKLSDKHSIFLITFEKQEDLQDEEEVQKFKEKCIETTIHWIPLQYHQKPRLAATLYDMAIFTKCARSVIIEKEVDVIHCRGYVPSFVGWFLKRMYKVPFIFDMRAFWPDEMVSAGRLKKSSMVYKFLKGLEKRCIEKADYIITLTIAAENYIIEHIESKNVSDRITTIPTCVALENFTLPGNNFQKNGESIVIGSVGTLTSWFKIDWFLSLYKKVKERYPQTDLRIISKSAEELINNKLKEYAIDHSNTVIKSCKFEDVPKEMHQMDVGVFFFEPGFSKLGSAPTRMGEFMACGVPCIANSGVGDVQHIIEKYDVGIVIHDGSDRELSRAANELNQLLEDPEISKRCRRAAEEWFSLDNGVEKYSSIYMELGSKAINESNKK